MGLISHDAVADYYDSLDFLYREAWGLRLHHGQFRSPEDSIAAALIRHENHIVSRLELTGGLRVCDIGCGYGVLARRLAVEFGCRVDGFTVSGNQHRVAVRRCRAPGVTFHHADWLANRLEPDSIDRIACVETLFHIQDPERAVREMGRVLAPGGVAVLAGWFLPERGPSALEKLTKQPIENGVRNLGKLLRLATVTRFLQGAGLAIERHEVVTAAVRPTLLRLGCRAAPVALASSEFWILARRRPGRLAGLAAAACAVAAGYGFRGLDYAIATVRKAGPPLGVRAARP